MSISLLLHPCVLPTQNAATRETPIQGEGCFLENGTASAGLGGVAFATTVIVVTGVTDPCPHQLSLQVSPLCFCNFMQDATPMDPTLHKRSGSGAAQDPVGKEIWSIPKTSTSFSQNEFLPPALWDGPMWSATTKWPAGVLKEGCYVRDCVGLYCWRGHSVATCWFSLGKWEILQLSGVQSLHLCHHGWHWLVCWVISSPWFFGAFSVVEDLSCVSICALTGSSSNVIITPPCPSHTSTPHLPVCPLPKCVLSKMAHCSLLSVYKSVFFNFRALLFLQPIGS